VYNCVVLMLALAEQPGRPQIRPAVERWVANE
jgi:hypothetical protein